MSAFDEEGNAKIERTMLGIEDHGLLTAYLTLAGPSWGQGFGGYSLSKGDACATFVRRTLDVLGVTDWEKLKGMHIRYRRAGGVIIAIGHILEDRWFEPGKEL